MSPISSRNSVPPLASTKSPRRVCVAPVNDPRTCPKSSLSSSASGTAAQLTATNGAFLRGPSAWMSRATSSFPVPVSPNTSTGVDVAATRRTSSFTARIPLLRPMRVPPGIASRTARRRATFSARIARSPIARSKSTRTTSSLNGLVT